MEPAKGEDEHKPQVEGASSRGSEQIITESFDDGNRRTVGRQETSVSVNEFETETFRLDESEPVPEDPQSPRNDEQPQPVKPSLRRHFKKYCSWEALDDDASPSQSPQSPKAAIRGTTFPEDLPRPKRTASSLDPRLQHGNNDHQLGK